MRNNIKLTLKTAKQLVKQEFGIKNPILDIECAFKDVFIYNMTLGRFRVTVENDWFDKKGLLRLSINTHTGSTINIFYDPYTLVETDI